MHTKQAKKKPTTNLIEESAHPAPPLSSEQTSKTSEELRHQYTEVCHFLRHYSSLRFVMFSVYFAVIAGVASLAFKIIEVKTPNADTINLLTRCAGLLTTIVFLLYEFRLGRLIRHYQKIAIELEKPLGYIQMTSRPKSSLTFFATRFLYIILMLFWVFMIKAV
jgi:hypothetical protein